MLKNTSNAYGIIAKFLHWFTALLIICLLLVGFFLEDFSIPIMYKIHKTMGFFALILIIARIFWRLANPAPGYDSYLPKLFIYAGHITHCLLYLFMLVVPLSAFIASNAAQRPVSFLFLFDMPSFFADKNSSLAKELMNLHGLFASILLFLICAHVVAAFYHHFIRKDNILERMLPKYFKKNNPTLTN
jgi:cytochrome b561